MLSKLLDCPIESGNDRYGAGSDRYRSVSDRCVISQVMFSFDPRIKDYRGSFVKAAHLPNTSLA